MKVVLYMASSVNGIIARENNEEDFLSYENWATLLNKLSATSCLVWGRKTYELVKGWQGNYLEDLKSVKKIIISRDGDFDLDSSCVTADSPKAALEKAVQMGFEEVIVSGGATINSAFAKANLLDEVMINIEPVLIGKGIPLFANEDFELKLELIESRHINQKIVQLRYKVKK